MTPHKLFVLLFLLPAFAAVNCSNAASEAATTVATTQGPDGREVFQKYCVACHGANGKLGLNGAKDLTLSTLTLEERQTLITNGRKLMTPFGEVLSPEEIKAVAEFTLTLKQ